MEQAVYHDILKNMIISIITNNLTIGRGDNDLEEFTVEEIANFIGENNVRIEQVIQIIINDFEDDNALHEIENMELDWVGEYLSDYNLI